MDNKENLIVTEATKVDVAKEKIKNFSQTKQAKIIYSILAVLGLTGLAIGGVTNYEPLMEVVAKIAGIF